MRRILGIETLGGGRFLVQTEEGDAFPMYKGELRHYGIREGEELGEESFREIMEELLPNRRKRKPFIFWSGWTGLRRSFAKS